MCVFNFQMTKFVRNIRSFDYYQLWRCLCDGPFDKPFLTAELSVLLTIKIVSRN